MFRASEQKRPVERGVKTTNTESERGKSGTGEGVRQDVDEGLVL